VVTAVAAEILEPLGAPETAEVPAGNKLTEVGVIPDDWVAEPLGALGSIETGRTPPTSNRGNYGNEFLFASPADLGSNKYIKRTEKMLSSLGFSISPHFPSGSILFVCIGSTIGKCAIAVDTLTSNQQINAVVPEDSFSSEYIYYALSAQASRVKAIAGLQAVPIVNKSQFANTLIPRPQEKHEQEAIARALSDADALVESLKRFIDKKRSIKQGTTQQLLTGKRRLSEFVKADGYRDTDFGRIPCDWQLIPLSRLLEFRNGLNKGRSFFGYGTPIINYMDVYSKHGLFASDIVGRVDVSRQELDAFEVRVGDVFFTRTSETVEEIGLSSVLLEEMSNTVFSGFVLRGRPKNDDLFDGFKKYCFRSDFVRRQIVSKSTYTTRALTNGKILSAVLLPVPPTKTEQRAIAEIISEMDEEILLLEERASKAERLKRGMMQELLTGRVRLV
jgi:type I restriction enzyme S subunit